MNQQQQNNLDTDHASLPDLEQRIAELEMLLHVRAQEVAALRVYEEQFRTVADFTYDWEYWLNPDGKLLYVSPSCERITGYRPEEFREYPGLIEGIIHRYDRARIAAHFADVLHNQHSHEMTYRIITRSGDVRWIGHACQPVYAADGRWLGQRASNRDITTQVQIAEAYRVLVENSLQGLFILQEGRVVFVNPAATRITGYTRDELLDMSPDDIQAVIYADDWPQIMQRSSDHQSDKHTPLDYTFRIIRKDGAIRWVQAYVVLATYQWKPAMQITCIDITARKCAEEALNASETRYRSIFENASIGIFHTTPEGQYLHANPALARILGYDSPQELMETVTNIAAQLYVDPGYRAKITRLLRENQGTALLENRYYRKDGSVMIANLHIWTIRDEHGNVHSFQGFIEDITERKKAEEQLQRANAQLVEWVATLQQHNHEMMLLNQMNGLLQSCPDIEAAYEVISTIASRLFVDQSGALYIHNAKSDAFEAVAHWGEQPPQSTLIQHAECQAVQQGRSFLLCKDSEGAPCDHAQDASDCSLLCVPLTDQNGVLGLLHLRSRLLENDEACLHWQQVAEMFGGQIAMALTNLSLLERLQHQVLHDALTGLFNRRYLDETLKRELQQAARSEQSLGIIMLDIDHFKHFNDTYGHDAGDVLLRAVGAFLQASTRYGDIACRYGGEEFTLVMPGASLEDTHQRADQLCEGVRQITVQYGAQSLPTITISLGVAAFPHHGTTDEEVMKAADNALYQAKTAGRNQVIVAPLLRQDERGH